MKSHTWHRPKLAVHVFCYNWWQSFSDKSFYPIPHHANCKTKCQPFILPKSRDSFPAKKGMQLFTPLTATNFPFFLFCLSGTGSLIKVCPKQGCRLCPSALSAFVFYSLFIWLFHIYEDYMVECWISGHNRSWGVNVWQFILRLRAVLYSTWLAVK